MSDAMRRCIVLLPALLLTLVSATSVFAEKRVALVIGIDTYDNLGADVQLKKARSDAAAVARTLKDLGFDVSSKDDLTRTAFNETWSDFLAKLEPGDTAAFFFAGHGVELGGQNYLLPKDIPSLRPGRDEQLRRESLSLQEFLADLREKKTLLNMVVIDACRDNPFPQLATRSLGRERGLAANEPPEGTFIMFSAGAGESALDRLDDDDKDPNSVFTRQLLPLMKTRGLSLTDLAKDVRLSVRKLAATVDHLQTPAYYDQVLGRFCLAGCTELRPVPQFRIVSPLPGSIQKGGRAVVKMVIDATPDLPRVIGLHVNSRQIERLVPDSGSSSFPIGERELDVPLANGRNIVRVTLGNVIGDKAQTLSLTHEGPGDLDRRGALYILAIGVDRYVRLGKTCGNSTCDLRYSGADARALVAAVEERMAPNFAQVIKRVLVNGGKPTDEPTAQNIRDALDMLDGSKETDTIMFFVSGRADGAMFVPSDAERSGASFRRATVVEWQVLINAMEEARGRRIMMIDAPTSGEAFNFKPGASVMVYTAGAWNKDGVLEDANLGHGIFTYAVIEGLKGKAGDAQKRQVTARGLAQYIRNRVDQFAKAMRAEEQEPQFFSGGDADEDHVLTTW
jgi:uncharacterized caspase-like protein